MNMWSDGYSETVRFTAGEVLSRREDGSAELNADELVVDWTVDSETTVFAGFRGEAPNLTRVKTEDGTRHELQVVGHLNFSDPEGIEMNFLTADGEVWRVEPGQTTGRQLTDDVVAGLVERATAK